MNSLRSETFLKPGFALISVLALVSLAALTATAFLASARLERTATRSIGDTTRLNMALNVGMESATKSLKFIVGDPPRPWNFVTTYWRTNSADEVGYLFVGKAVASTTLMWSYVCGFTPSSWTNLSADLMSSNIIFTNTNCQGSFSNDASTFMSTKGALNFSPDPPKSDLKCTRIDMIGGRKSPPVGWVYIKQDIRTNPSSTNTANLPVARFAYFTEDLSGLIDTDRMGGSSARSSGAATGTNAEEISLANLTGVTYSGLSSYTNNRPQYLTPGMLLYTNGGFLNNTNDLRYFASRLPKCLWTTNYTNYDRTPYVPISSSPPIYPTNAGYRKLVLNNLNAGGQSIIAARITNNFPMFTNRAGGMNANLYVNALAANIVDYADADSLATVVNVGGINAVGYDSYPLITHVYDRIDYTSGANAQLVVTTFIQLWNPANVPTALLTGGTFRYSFNQQITYTRTDDQTVTSTTLSSTPLANSNFTIPNTNFSANQFYITSITNTISLTNTNRFPGFPTNTNSVKLTNNGTLNRFTITIGGATITPAISFFQSINTITNNVANITGSVLGLEQNFPNLKLWNADPRMLPYRGLGTAMSYADIPYTNTIWKSYPARKDPIVSGDPAYWLDGGAKPVSSNSLSTNYNATTSPTPGFSSSSDPAPCKISNFGSFTNICELGNVFDPIQWNPVAPLNTNTIVTNNNINSTWTNNSTMWGGGSSLRIGRPEHSRFAFTNLGGTYPVPSLGTSAAGLLDIFCTTNAYNWAGKININTAPLPVLAALAGGITVTNTCYSGPAPTNQMIFAFTNGVARFRNTYPFITPSQLAFISTDYGTTSPHWTNTWPNNAVFSTNPSGGLQGPTAINDQGREEWFSKIYNLTCVQSFNYRIYVVAQLTDTNGNPKGAAMRKYYDLYLNNNTPNAGANPDLNTPSISPVILSETAY